MIFIGADHAGFKLKQSILKKFQDEIDLTDMGTNSEESTDYPIWAAHVCDKILRNPGALGILICGTGIGMSIAANKVTGIRAAAVSEAVSARMAREHNDAQVLCLGARIISSRKAFECIRAFLSARFDTSHPRHKRRLELIARLEVGS